MTLSTPGMMSSKRVQKRRRARRWMRFSPASRAASGGDDTSGWTGFIFPNHVAALLERVLIARGGAKALAIRDETERYAAHLEATARAFEKVSARLEARTRSVETVLVDDFGARCASVLFPTRQIRGA